MSNSNPILFSKVRIEDSHPEPVIIVGLPRCGTSFLADVVSQIGDWYIFDDLYLYRQAKALDAIDKPLTEKQLVKLVGFLGWQIHARIKFGIFCVPKMQINDIEPMNQAMIETFKNSQVFWYQLQSEWMKRLAVNQGCKFWGYKAPQDFQITKKLLKVYPGAKFIFVYRDPRKMLRSLKFVRDADGHPGQYHPFFYSLYWKKAVKSYSFLKASHDNKLITVKYEDLLDSYQKTAIKIASFLGVELNHKIDGNNTNSSFKGAKSDNDICPTEYYICESLCKKELIYAGYKTTNAKPRLIDIIEIIRISYCFSKYQIKRLIKSKSGRVSIMMYLKGTGSNK